MAKIIVKRNSQVVGCAIKHDVYLNNGYLGTLKNGGVLTFDASAGSYTLYFQSRSKRNAEFCLNVNEDQETVEILTEFNMSGTYTVKYADNLPHYTSGGVKCPSCGSTDLTTVSDTHTTGKDFNSSNACCGYLLCGPLGLLFGVDKKGKQQHTDNFWVCKNCGNKFKM